MGDTFLRPVIERLVDLLAGEVNLLKGVHEEVNSLKRELELLQFFLKDAEVKLAEGELTSAVKVWLKQLKDDADSIEDVLDEYIYHMEQHGHESGFINTLHKFWRHVKALKPRFGIVSAIPSIKRSLDETLRRGEILGLRPFDSRAIKHLDARVHLRLPFTNKEEIVGIESTSEAFVKRLVEVPSECSSISLVSEGGIGKIILVGEVGIGKTTLAMNVYDDEVIKRHFDCRVWVAVSQTCDLDKILKSIKSQIIPKEAEELIEGYEKLIDHVKQHLQGKRCLIVFDDVWRIDFWDAIRHAMPSGGGCKMIITTRYTTVAASFKETSFDLVKELELWPFSKSNQLFRRKLHVSGITVPPELECLCRQILSKCQGLPLVVAAVAGLLSRKENTPSEWQKVLDSLYYKFEESDELSIVSNAFILSYNDLPYHLKSCFLYFGVFPPYNYIVDRRLYTLWIAEGFIHPRGSMTMEHVAEEYLNELINKNLISSHVDIQRRRTRYCYVHKLMHEIILKLADEVCFFQTLDRNNSRCQDKSRRISTHETTEDVLENVHHSRTRSLVLNRMKSLTKSSLVRLFKNCRLLRVLDLEASALDVLPKEVGNLVLLKYLNLENAKVKELPKSIGKLHNLQTLNVSGTFVRELPKEINMLQNLRHLLASFGGPNLLEYFFWDSEHGARMHEGIGKLEELQTLACVAEIDNINFIKELGNLTKLRILMISTLTSEVGKALGDYIKNWHHLETLTLGSSSQVECLDLNWIGISSSPFPTILPTILPCLSVLGLNCKLQEFPMWISNLHGLRKLRLWGSRLTDEPLKYLKDLRHLEYLEMNKAYDGNELPFETVSFRKLKILILTELEKLEVVRIDEGALPLLEELKLRSCPLMKENVPNFQHLTNLKEFNLIRMPMEFIAAMQPDGGSDYWKVQHIPSTVQNYSLHNSFKSCLNSVRGAPF